MILSFCTPCIQIKIITQSDSDSVFVHIQQHIDKGDNLLAQRILNEITNLPIKSNDLRRNAVIKAHLKLARMAYDEFDSIKLRKQKTVNSDTVLKFSAQLFNQLNVHINKVIDIDSVEKFVQYNFFRANCFAHFTQKLYTWNQPDELSLSGVQNVPVLSRFFQSTIKSFDSIANMSMKDSLESLYKKPALDSLLKYSYLRCSMNEFYWNADGRKTSADKRRDCGYCDLIFEEIHNPVQCYEALSAKAHCLDKDDNEWAIKASAKALQYRNEGYK
jgi:hypothetical protein